MQACAVELWYLLLFCSVMCIHDAVCCSVDHNTRCYGIPFIKHASSSRSSGDRVEQKHHSSSCSVPQEPSCLVPVWTLPRQINVLKSSRAISSVKAPLKTHVSENCSVSIIRADSDDGHVLS